MFEFYQQQQNTFKNKKFGNEWKIWKLFVSIADVKRKTISNKTPKITSVENH